MIDNNHEYRTENTIGSYREPNSKIDSEDEGKAKDQQN